VRAAGLSILLSIILNVCVHIVLTSIKMDIVNINIYNIIDCVRSAIAICYTNDNFDQRAAVIAISQADI